jgi:hypothetical protein
VENRKDTLQGRESAPEPYPPVSPGTAGGSGALLERYPWAKAIKDQLDGRTLCGSGDARAAGGTGSGTTGPRGDNWRSGGVGAGEHSPSGPTLAPGATSSESSSRTTPADPLAALCSEWTGPPTPGLLLVIARWGSPAARQVARDRRWSWKWKEEPVDRLLLHPSWKRWCVDATGA